MLTMVEKIHWPFGAWKTLSLSNFGIISLRDLDGQIYIHDRDQYLLAPMEKRLQAVPLYSKCTHIAHLYWVHCEALNPLAFLLFHSRWASHLINVFWCTIGYRYQKTIVNSEGKLKRKKEEEGDIVQMPVTSGNQFVVRYNVDRCLQNCWK